MEYEIKLLGEASELRKVFNYFCIQPAERNRNYAFNTYYLDYSNSFYTSGYSLRHRTGVFEINKESGTELKALEGEVKGVSARLELQRLGLCPVFNYEKLKRFEDYPADAPQVNGQGLVIEFATSVRRVERRCLINIDGVDVLIEAALDDIAYLKPMERGEGLYDVLLTPEKTEHELEFELKSDCDLKQFFDWVRLEVIKEADVKLTTKSKALRAREIL